MQVSPYFPADIHIQPLFFHSSGLSDALFLSFPLPSIYSNATTNYGGSYAPSKRPPSPAGTMFSALCKMRAIFFTWEMPMIDIDFLQSCWSMKSWRSVSKPLKVNGSSNFFSLYQIFFSFQIYFERSSMPSLISLLISRNRTASKFPNYEFSLFQQFSRLFIYLRDGIEIALRTLLHIFFAQAYRSNFIMLSHSYIAPPGPGFSAFQFQWRILHFLWPRRGAIFLANRSTGNSNLSLAKLRSNFVEYWFFFRI